jgi:hypothetical protein
MTPTKIAQRHWNAFVRDCEPLPARGYREALEELQSLADTHLMALDEEEGADDA